jgi:hypothetical protein
VDRVRGRSHDLLRPESHPHVAKQRPLTLEAHDPAVHRDGEVQLLVAECLPANQLHHDLEAVLGGLHEHVGALALDIRHARTQPLDLALVRNAFVEQEPAGDEHDEQRDGHRGEDSGVCVPEFPPALASPLGAMRDIGSRVRWFQVH